MKLGLKPIVKMRWAFSVATIVLFMTNDARADWIHGYISPRAGIDSIQRIVHINDFAPFYFFGSRIAAAGDVNNDGYGDVLIGRSYSGNGENFDSSNYVFLYHGGSSPDAQFDGVFDSIVGLLGNVGDVNADANSDFAACWPPYVRVFLGGSAFDGVPDMTMKGYYTYISSVADFLGDGRIDFAVSEDIGDGHSVSIVSLWPVFDTVPILTISDTARSFGGNIAVDDFNGDGHPDLAVAAFLNRDSSFVKFYWGGPSMDAIADKVIWSRSDNFGDLLVPVGDFNGDGYHDIYIAGGYEIGLWTDSSWHKAGIYFGGPGFDGKLDVSIRVAVYWAGDSDVYQSPESASRGGDINHDGYNDFITGRFSNYSGGETRVFLGGPNPSNSGDVVITDYDLPDHPCATGRTVAGIGDFNGDGADDFATYSQSVCGPGRVNAVNIFGGWNSKPTDIPDDNRTLPSDIELSQNYPNPFNPSTTIEFEIAKPARVVVRVYNTLGEVVRTLVDRQFAVGTHRVVWDGRDDHGREVASGVYLYRLTAGGVTQEKKMVLVR